MCIYTLTLADMIQQAHRRGSIRGLAAALGLSGFRDNDAASMQWLAAVLCEQMLQLCQELVAQGICHRDIKPGNLLVCPETNAVKLIDFGAAAAVGLEGRVGFDEERGPCDEKYHAPEQLIEAEHWEAYDVYSVGLTLTRVLFRPLWDGEQFNAFMADYRGPACKENLDLFFSNLILRQVPDVTPERRSKALKKAPRTTLELFTSMARRPRGAEYIELAQQVPQATVPDEENIDAALEEAERWMEEQRQEMTRVREHEATFAAMADVVDEGGARMMSLGALGRLLRERTTGWGDEEVADEEVAAVFAELDADGNGFIDLNEFLRAMVLADALSGASLPAAGGDDVGEGGDLDEEEEEEEEEEVQN